MLKNIADYMVESGTKSTLYGNYCFDFEEIEKKFNIKLDEEKINLIYSFLMENKKVAEVDTEEEFSIYFYTNFCPNLEV